MTLLFPMLEPNAAPVDTAFIRLTFEPSTHRL